MLKNNRRVGLLTRLGLVGALAVGVTGLSTAPASATNDNFGHAVRACASMMLPTYLDSHGSITMPMPDGSTMIWRTFGEMVTYMQSHMCA